MSRFLIGFADDTEAVPAAAAKHTALAAVSAVLLGALALGGSAAADSAKKGDPVPPSTPTNLHVVSATTTAVTIAWDPAQDDGVAGYYVSGDRGKTTVSVPTYMIDGRQCGESIDISVQAFDDAGNRSDRARVTASTAACPDTQPPSVPSGFVQAATTQNAVVLDWQPSSDNVGVVGYGVYRDLTRIASPADPSVTVSGLTCGSSASYKIDAVDAAGNRSGLGTAFVQTTSCGDTQPPTVPTNLAVMSQTTTSLSLGWSASSDNVGVAGYHVLVGGGLVATVTQPGATLSSLRCGSAYSVSVDAFDKAGNRSPSTSKSASTGACSTAPPPGDTTAPSAPSGLVASNISQTGLTLAWNASTDNVGVTGYDVFRGGAKVGTVSSTSSILGSLSCGTAYTMGVAAHDAAGNASQQAQLTVSTASCPSAPPPGDTTPPSQPTNLAVSSSTLTSVTLSWGASTDNVAVSEYRTYANGTLAVVVVQPGATVSGLSCGTAYAFDVEAVDVAGNRSSRASIVGSAKACPDTQPPTVPSNVVASSRTATSIALTWNASTDNVGVVGYGLYRGGSAVGSSTSTIGIFSGLTCNTNYTLAIDAYDAAGNRSSQTVVMVSTSACPDTTPPSTPTGLSRSNVTQTGLTLTWNSSTDNVGVTGYDVYSNGVKVGSTAATSYAVGNLACGGTYTLGVEAYDAMHNVSARGTLSATTTGCSGPANTSLPVISGTSQVGSTLTVSDGAWSGATPLSFSYQWQRCDSAGSSCSSVSGETQNNHVLGSADVGATLRAAVRATNSSGSATSTSSPSPIVAVASAQQVSCDKVAATNGSDSNPGTRSAPLATAQGLFDSLASGQTGCLRGGTYTSSAMYVLDMGGKTNVRITSYPGERAKLVGIIVIRPTAAGSQLSYLDIEGAGVTHPVKIYSSDVVIEHNDITNRNQNGSCMMLGSGDPAYGWATRITIRQNRFHDCGSPANDNKDHAIYAQYLQDSEITGNLFYNTAAYAIHLFPNAQRNRITYNVIDGGGVSVRGGIIFAGDYGLASSDNVVEYNVIAFAAGYDISYYWGSGAGTGNVARNNCVWSGASGDISAQVGFTATNNTTADPLFANRGGHDYSLGAGPCRTLLGTDPAASVG